MFFAIRQQRYRSSSAAVGVRFIAPAYIYSPRIRNSFRIHSRNVRNVFVICTLHIRHVKVWFLRQKSMVFGVQKGGFYIAKVWFLHCKSMVFVFWMLCCCNLFRMLSQSIRSGMAIRSQCFGNSSAMFWQSVSHVLANRQPCFGKPFAMFWQTVRNILAIRSQCFGKPLAAVGVDLSCPHIWKHPQNDERKCACDEMKTHI